MIKLNRLTDYAVTLLTQMVRRGESVFAASDLAEQTGLPLPTVSKILKKLTKSGLITAQRGAMGGYKLAQSPTAISMATVIEDLDGPIAITDCADGGDHSCRAEAVCPMRANWNKVNIAIRQALLNVSLQDMVVSLPFARSA